MAIICEHCARTTRPPPSLPEEVRTAVAQAAHVYGMRRKAGYIEQLARTLGRAMAMHVHDVDVQRIGCERMLYLAQRSATGYVAAGGVGVVVDAMNAHGADHIIQNYGCQIFQMKECAAAMLALGGENAVVNAMSVETDRAVQLAALAACNALMLCSEAVVSVMYTAGVAELVVTGMHAHCSCPSVQAEGCTALHRLALVDSASRQATMGALCLDAVLRAMRLHSERLFVMAAACRALCSLAAGDESCKQAIVANGALPVLHVVMRTHAGDLQLSLECNMTIHHIAGSANRKADETLRKRALAEAGTASAVVASMQEHPTDAQLQCAGCTSLRRICSGDSYCKKEVARIGGAAALAAAMNSFPNDAALHRECCDALRLVACEDPRSVLDAGGVAVMVGALSTHVGDEQIRCDVRKALSLIATWEPIACRRALVAAGGFSVLTPREDFEECFMEGRSRWSVLQERPKGLPTF